VSSSSIVSSLSTSSASSGAGLDVGATVDQLIYTEQAPERLLQAQQSKLRAQATALRDMNASLETLETAVNVLKDLTGAFGSRTIQSSNDLVLTASTDAGATLGQHTISISQLATISSQYSDTLASANAAFMPGDLQFTVGDGPTQTITFDAAHSTLSTAVDYINGLNLGVSASVITDALGSRLTLVSNTSGKAGDLRITVSPTGLGFHLGAAGQNATLIVDGVPVESATNKVTGVLPGITLNLMGKTGEAPVSITVATDTDKATTAIHSMVNAYNTILKNINTQFTYNASSGMSGTLAGNSSVRSLQSRLLSAMSFQLSGSNRYTTLRSLGIEMQDDGTLSVDDTKLTSALKSDPKSVETFFRGASSDGFASRFSAQLMSLTDSVNGPLVTDARGIDNSVASIGDQIDDFEVRIAMRRQILTDQYTKIDTLLRQLPLLQQQIGAQLGTLK
jgi:flagellar hook-associated protein 2